MSKAGRNLQVGDEALTDYGGRGLTLVRIVKRLDGTCSQSGICFQVWPALDRFDPDARYDADWFEPAPANLI